MKKTWRDYLGAQDMTQGSPLVNLITFSIPLLIGNFAQQMYNTVDSIIVGRYVGDMALAAVGASNPILNLLLVLFMGISTGAGIMVSQYFGAHQQQELSRTVGTCLILTFFTSLLIMGLGCLASRPLLTLLHTPPEIYDMAADYLLIIFLGILTAAYYNILSGILRGLGDSLSPLLFLLVACALNIVLDIWFVAGFGWGVSGVAAATILAQGVSAILCGLRLASMRHVVRCDRSTLRMDRATSLQIARLGLPSGITQAIFSLAMIVVQSLTNSFGPLVITTTTAVMRVDGFAMMPNFTFGMAMTTFAGQNIGAGKVERVAQGTRDGMRLGLIVSSLLTLAILCFGKTMMGWFTNTQAVIDLGMHQMRIIAVGYIAFTVSQILSGVMRGAGDTLPPMWIALTTTVILRVPIAYVWAFLTRSETLPTGSPDALFYSLLISWIMGALLTFIWFRRGTWRNRSITGKTEVA